MTDKHAQTRRDIAARNEHMIVNKALALAHRNGLRLLGVDFDSVLCAATTRAQVKAMLRHAHNGAVVWIDENDSRHWIRFNLGAGFMGVCAVRSTSEDVHPGFLAVRAGLDVVRDRIAALYG
jgi:hypothetical protein